MDKRDPAVKRLRECIIDEVFGALGLKKDGILRSVFGWLFYPPAQRFALIFARVDQEVGRNGLSAGCRLLLDELSVRVQAHGVEHLRDPGPLLVISNHPAAYDAVILGAHLPRPDLKILVYEVPFYQALINIYPHLISASGEPTGRMLALRGAIQHIRKGGALVQFGTGRVEPDPAILLGAGEFIDRWSPSLEAMLRKAPETCVVLAIVSGVQLKKFAFHPLTRLRRDPIYQRRLGEFLQVMQQMLFPRSIQIDARVSFAPGIRAADLIAECGSGSLMPAIKSQAQHLLLDHQSKWYGRSG